MKFYFTTTDQLKNLIRNHIDLNVGLIICLEGEMGSGKTTFTQQLALLLGITTQVNSPTFIIHNEYEIPIQIPSKNPRKLHHLDLYRLETTAELEELKLKQAINSMDITSIEWADKFKTSVIELIKAKNMRGLWVEIKILNAHERVISIEEINENSGN